MTKPTDPKPSARVEGQRLPGKTQRATLPVASYGLDEQGLWEVCTPNGRRGRIDDQTDIVEHDDGTISTKPFAFEPMSGRAGWRGSLDHGVFVEAV